MQSAFAAACSARRHGSVTMAAASPAMTFVTVNASVEAIAPVTRPSDGFNATSIAKRMLADPKMYVSGTVAQNRNDARASANTAASKADVLATLRDGAKSTAAYVRGLSDQQQHDGYGAVDERIHGIYFK